MVDEVIIKCEPFAPEYQGSNLTENSFTEKPFTEKDGSHIPFEDVLVKTESIKSEHGEDMQSEASASQVQALKQSIVILQPLETEPNDQEIEDTKIHLKREVLPDPNASKMILNSTWEGIQTRRQRFLSERRRSPPIGRKRKGKEKGRRKRLYYTNELREAFKETPENLNGAADQVTTALNGMTNAINMLAKANDKLAKAKLLHAKLEIARAQAAGLQISIVNE